MRLDRNSLLHDIRALMDAPLDGEQAPFLEQIERTLTDGYAHAMALEAERSQLERQLAALARRVAAADPDGPAGELSALAQRLTSADGHLEELRQLLGSLRERAHSVRST